MHQQGNDIATALWYCAPGQAELRQEHLPAASSATCRLAARFSCLSRGTESLVFAGTVPESEFTRMRAPFQAGAFPFPVKYGYQMVAEVERGPAELVGRTVFALHPHQDRFDLAAEAVLPLPEGLPPRRAVLGANMETALNALWDGGAASGDRILVIGAGVVGALVASLSARLPGAEVSLIDIDPRRAALAAALGIRFATPETAPRDADLVFHASGAPEGLLTALSLAGREASIVEMSWYGSRTVTLPLGAAFHALRLRLLSSQVGQIPAARLPRWTHRRRLEKALELLRDDPRLDALLEPDIAFADLPARLPSILGRSGALAQVVVYPR